MNPILIFKDENAINTQISEQSTAKEFWQNIVDQYNSLEFPEEKKLKGNDLFLFTQNPKLFIVDKVTQGETLSIGSMPISKEKAFEILELPTELYKIISQVEKIRKGEHSSGYAVRNYVSNFNVKESVVEFTEKFIQEIEIAYSIFATTPEKKHAWELMEEIASKLNDLRAITSKSGYTLNDADISLFFGGNEFKNSHLINKANPDIIKRLN